MERMREIKVKSYAKFNLAFDILGTREDGYHSIETIMQQVALFDQLTIGWAESTDGKTEIQIKTNKYYIPVDERNIAYKAAMLMLEEKKDNKSGTLSINIEKKIPVAAGLGGGSGNGAAVLIALNKLWKLNLSIDKLCYLGSKLGADVPFFVLVQTTDYSCAEGRGKGDILKPLHCRFHKWLVLVKPKFGVSTREVFSGIDDCIIEKRPNMVELKKGLEHGNEDVIYEEMVNVLETYTLSKYAEVKALKEKLKKTEGVKKVIMSGSGPTVVGIYQTYEGAKKVCLKMREEGYEAYWARGGKEKGGRYD